MPSTFRGQRPTSGVRGDLVGGHHRVTRRISSTCASLRPLSSHAGSWATRAPAHHDRAVPRARSAPAAPRCATAGSTVGGQAGRAARRSRPWPPRRPHASASSRAARRVWSPAAAAMSHLLACRARRGAGGVPAREAPARGPIRGWSRAPRRPQCKKPRRARRPAIDSVPFQLAEKLPSAPSGSPLLRYVAHAAPDNVARVRAVVVAQRPHRAAVQRAQADAASTAPRARALQPGQAHDLAPASLQADALEQSSDKTS